jgi:AraC-like DNA-binding protein
MRSIGDAHFHIVERGGAWLLLPRKRPLALAGGDLLIIMDGKGHVIADSPESKAAAIVPPPETVQDVVFLENDEAGAETQLVCGQFQIEDRESNPLVSVLPRVLHLKSERTGEWLLPMLRLLAQESRNEEPGRKTIISRLMEIIFVQALRGWVSELDENAGGWLGALRDPQIGQSLALMHKSPEHDWSIESLARSVGMSRSPFFERFKALTGETPLAYLTRWRMHVARRLLLDDLTISEIAPRIGYSSEAAFSNAFKRAVGQSPTVYRSTRRKNIKPAA